MSESIMPPPVSAPIAWGPVIVSVLAMAIFTAAIGVAWVTKDSSLGTLLGMAGSYAGTVVGYWLGSSSGSRSKDVLIAAKPQGTIS
jgi:uncharacterized membrane protein YdjX (TVP38/TMEM64 family)